MGCHYLDLGFWALNLKHPTTIQAEGPPPHAESTPSWQHVRYEFPRLDERGPVLVTWTHGTTKTPDVFAENSLPGWAWGVFVGDAGMLAVDYSRHLLLPESRFEGYAAPTPRIPASTGHHREWITACKTGSPTSCNFDYADAVTETMLLGNIAFRTGHKLRWDGEQMCFPDDAGANALLQRPYRSGWEF